MTLGRGLWLTVLGPAALEALPTAGVGWLGVACSTGSTRSWTCSTCSG